MTNSTDDSVEGIAIQHLENLLDNHKRRVVGCHSSVCSVCAENREIEKKGEAAIKIVKIIVKEL